MARVLRIKLSELRKLFNEKKELPAFMKKDDKEDGGDKEEKKESKKPWEKDKVDEQRKAPIKVSKRVNVPTGKECPEGTKRVKWGKEDAPQCETEEVVEAKQLREMLYGGEESSYDPEAEDVYDDMVDNIGEEDDEEVYRDMVDADAVPRRHSRRI
jgi:hypothetical protein